MPYPENFAAMRRYHFIFTLVRKHVLSYLVGVAALVATLWIALSIPRFLQEAIDLLGSGEDPTGDAFLGKVWLILVLAITIIFTRTASRLFFFTPGRRVEFDLKNNMLTHLTTLQRDYYQHNGSGAIISRINNDINWVRMLVGFGVMNLTNSLATLTLAPYYMYLISPRLTLYTALPVLTAFLVLQWAIRLMRKQQQISMKAMQDLSEYTVESYTGVEVLKTYRMFNWAEERFSDLSGTVRDVAIRISRIRAFFMPLLMHMVNGLKVMLVLLGGLLVVEGGLTMGQFTAYALYLSMMVPPLMGLTFMMFVVQRGLIGLTSLETIFSTQPGLPAVSPEAEAALPAEMTDGLRVSGLVFAYPENPGTPVLDGVGLEIRPGEVVGVFGTIGSGKTTLVNLINRYLTPPPGTVFWEGQDVTTLSLETLRKRIVTVTQEPFLFSDTVRENIAFATEQGQADLDAAIRSAALNADLERFPEGMDTQVGEKGITLSGGQKQRISLARSILKTCDLLILDDVLSAVDHETERFLVEEIYRFRHARSLLIISHRISALERADRVVVLEGGRVAAQGSHEDLIQAEGPYRQAWIIQREQMEAPPEGSTQPQGAAAGEAN